MGAQHFRQSVVAAVVALGWSTVASAAMIQWSPGPNYNGPNGFSAIQTNGFLVEAVNLGDGGQRTVDPGGLNITFQPADKLNSVFFNSGNPGTNDAEFNAIIDRTDFNSANVTVNDFLSGLTPGRDYQVQLFASDSRACCANRASVFGDGQGNQTGPVTQGSFTSVLGFFTADAATQALRLEASPGNNPVLSAYVLLDVSPTPPPAPASVVVGQAIQNRAAQDGFHGTAVFDTPLSAVASGDGQVALWSFFNNNGAAVGRDATPVLIEKLANGDHVVRGIGETRTVTGVGPQFHRFDVVEGTDVFDSTSGNFHMAIRYGDATSTNPGVVEFDNAAGIPWDFYGSGGGAENLVLDGVIPKSGANQYFDNLGRAYSMNFLINAPGAALVDVPIGNNLTARASASDGARQQVFYTNNVAMPDEGTADSVSVFWQGDAAGQFNILQLRPTGMDGEFDVVYDSGAISPSALGATANAVNVFDFPNGETSVLAGDIFGHFGDGIPFSTGGDNPQVINFPTSLSAFLNANGPIRLDGTTPGIPLRADLLRDYAWAVNFSTAVAVPEPTTALLGLLALAGLGLRRRRVER